MLEFAYRASDKEESDTSGALIDKEKSPYENMLSCIALYRVADKYDFPELLKEVEMAFDAQLKAGLPLISINEFVDIVTMVYDLPHVGPEHPLAIKLLEPAQSGWLAVPAINGAQGSIVLLACEAAPEYGRDVMRCMFKRAGELAATHGARDGTTALGTLFFVTCPHCRLSWSRSSAEPKHGHCSACGKHVEDWSLWAAA